MFFLRKLLIITGLLVFGLTACGPQLDDKIITLATTTSTDDSGLLEYLLPKFEAYSGLQVRVISVGTGKALKMGEQGDVDVLMVHAKLAEQVFVDAGFGVERVEFMYNDFILVGPKEDSAGLKNLTSIKDALRAVRDTQSQFVSRGDNSGTHIEELFLWENAGIELKTINYRESGQGMGKTLQIANELGAHTLVDRGTWLSYRAQLNLGILFEGRPPLINQYAMILVSPERYPDLNTNGAQALIDWLSSEQGQGLIGEFKLQGSVLFKPNA